VAEKGRRPIAHSRTDRPPNKSSVRTAGQSIERSAQCDDAETTIGYAFRDPGLLDEALTHKSHANELRERETKHNERLEFLGDAVLTLITSEHLAAAFPTAPEGELSKLKAQLVSEASLARAARRLAIGQLLRLGKGEELTKGREKSSLLANTVEALLGGIYLDGGLEPARAFTLRVLGPELKDLRSDRALGEQDYKTQVQEWCQKRYETLPEYVTVKESGPDHQKTFEVQLKVQGEVLGVGSGRSKKEAEQMAAKQAMKQAVHG
jgi:ribonuclease-3